MKNQNLSCFNSVIPRDHLKLSYLKFNIVNYRVATKNFISQIILLLFTKIVLPNLNNTFNIEMDS